MHFSSLCKVVGSEYSVVAKIACYWRLLPSVENGVTTVTEECTHSLLSLLQECNLWDGGGGRHLPLLF